MPLAAVAAIGIAGAIGGSLIGANATGNAAETQAQAADNSAQLQAETANQSTQLQAGEYNNAQTLGAPFVQSGESALANLDSLMGVTPSTFQNTPLYQPNPLTVQPITNPRTGLPIGQQPQPTPGVNPLTGQPLGGTATSTAPQGTNPGFQAGGSPNSPGGSTNTAQPIVRAGSQTGGGPNAILSPGTPTQNPNGLNPAPAAPAAGATSSTGAPTLGSQINPALGAPGSLAQGWNQTFTSPTAAQAEQMPGYQFQQQQGQQAVQNSAAASGNLLTGNTAAALDQYSQGLASTDYNNLYNQSMGNYQTNYNTFEQNQANQYNRLASLAGLGQVSAQQLGNQGIQTGANIGNTLTSAANSIGQSGQNAAAATASGYIGQANAINGGISSASNGLSSLALLQALQGGSSNPNDISGLFAQGTPGVN